MGKKARREAILRIVDEHTVQTQAQLLALLQKNGFDVTQATVSRDVARLGLIKVRGGDGTSHYTRRPEGETGDVVQRVRWALREYVLSLDHSGHLIVIKTLSGRANAVAAALDEWQPQGVLATLAGDDAVLVIARAAMTDEPVPAVAALLQTFNELRE